MIGAASEVGASLYAQESIVWLAAPLDGAPFDEDTPPRPARITQSALDGERLGRESAGLGGLRSATLRFGFFYSEDSSHTRALGAGLAKRTAAIVGRGDAVWSLLHPSDAARAFVALAESPRSGLWHVVDDQPTTVGDFFGEPAARIVARPPRSVPAWLARLVAGREATGFLTSSFRTTNARFSRDFDWRLAHPSFREGLEAVVASWRDEGYLVR